MKTTYDTTGFFADEAYRSGLPSFLEQYRDRFPGLSYLHLSLKEADISDTEEDIHYYGEGCFLKIRLAKWTTKLRPNPFEVYAELRSVFDRAVEAHLQTHQWI